MPAIIEEQNLTPEVANKYQVQDNTFKRKIKDVKEDRLEVEIGDIHTPDEFLPQFKLKRWDNEVNFSVRFIDGLHGNTKKYMNYDGEKISWERGNYKATFYDKPDASDAGGFEFEIYLGQRPPVDSLTFSINTKGLKFYYQKELTDQEIIKWGIVRPDNVVGSYAVYHATKKHNVAGYKDYKTGKAFHIYRPHVVDNDGNETWGTLDIDEQAGTMTISVDSGWLDNAVYPVIVDPTFGYSEAGGTSVSDSGYDMIAVSKFAVTEAGSVTKVTRYGGSLSGSVAERGIIYTDDSTDPDELVVLGSEQTLDATEQWNDLPVAATDLSIADYHIGWFNDGSHKYWYDTGTTDQWAFDAGNGVTLTYPTAPDPFNIDNQLAREMSVYATYTPSVDRYPDILGSSSGGIEVTSLSHTVTSGTDMLLICIGNHQGGYASAVTFNTSETAYLIDRDTTTSNETSEIWYVPNPTATTANIAVTWSGGSGEAIVGMNIDNVKNSASIATSTDSGDSSTADLNITTNADVQSLVIHAVYSEADPTLSRVEHTEVQNLQDDSYENFAVAYVEVPPSTTEYCQWNLSSGQRWAMVAVALEQKSTFNDNSVKSNIVLGETQNNSAKANILNTYHNGIIDAWAVTYDASVLPESDTPAWTESFDTPTTAEITDNTFHLVVADEERNLYYIQDSSIDTSGIGVTAEARWKRVSGAGDGYETFPFSINDTAETCDVTYFNGDMVLTDGVNSDTVTSSDPDNWHVYRATIKGHVKKLYVDGELAATVTLTGSTWIKEIAFGDWRAATTGIYASEQYWDYVYYRTDGDFGPMAQMVKANIDTGKHSSVKANIEVGKRNSAKSNIGGKQDNSAKAYIENTIVENKVTANIAFKTDWDVTSAIVGDWKMNASSWSGVADEVVDDSGNEYHGVAVNGATTIAGGKLNRAGQLDGDTDYLDLGSDAGLNLTTAMSFEIWARPHTSQEICYTAETGGNSGLAAKVESNENSSTWSWQLRYGSPDSCRLGFQANDSGGGTVWVTAGEDLTNNEWQHIVITFDGTELIFYLNNNVVDRDQLIGNIASYENKLLIGSEGWSNLTDYFDGDVDNCRLYNRAVTPSEVNGLYNDGDGTEYRAWPSQANSAKANIEAGKNNSVKANIILPDQTTNNSAKSNFKASYTKNNSAIASLWVQGQVPNYTKANIFVENNTQNNSVTANIEPRVRYWVGNGGNVSSTSHWAYTSGGSSGAPVPDDPNIDIYFDANSFDTGSQTVTLDQYLSCHDMDWTGVTDTPTFTGSGSAVELSGSLTFVSGMVVEEYPTGWINVYLNSSNENDKTITTAGKKIEDLLTDFNGATTDKWTVQDTLNLGGLELYNGTFDANDNNVNIEWGVYVESDSYGAPTLYMGSGTWTITDGDWNAEDYSPNPMTIYGETSTIVFPADGFFYGGGQTYYDIDFSAGAGYITYGTVDSATVNDLILADGEEYIFGNFSTTTINGNFDATGTEGNLVRMIRETAASNYTNQSTYNAGISMGTTSDTYTYQTFVVSNAITVKTAYARLSRVGAATDYSIRARIYEDDGGSPGDLVATCTADVSASTIAAYSSTTYASFDFSEEVLVAGTYWIRFEQIGGSLSDSNYVLSIINSSDTNTYPNGEGYFKESAGSITLMSTITGTDYADLTFAIRSDGKFWLSKDAGTVSVDYVSLLGSAAVGGATWHAGFNSTDEGSNEGWFFGHTQGNSVKASIVVTNTNQNSAKAEILNTSKPSFVTANISVDTLPLSDDFGDASLDADKWQRGGNATDTSTEEDGVLKVQNSTTLTSGYVRSRHLYAPKYTTMLVKVAQHCSDGGFKLCPTDPAGHQWDIYSEDDWYNFQGIASTVVSPNKKVGGVGPTQIGGDSPTLTVPYWIRMVIDDDSISFDYRDDGTDNWTNVSSETWSLDSAITDPHFMYFTAYNVQTTGVVHYDDAYWLEYAQIEKANSVMANIELAPDYGNSAKANIIVSEEKENSAKASIVVTEEKNNNAKTDILRAYSKANSSVGNIWAEGQYPNSVTANILVTGTKQENSSKANILRSNEEQDNSTKANVIILDTKQNNSVKASVVVTESQEEYAKANIVAITTKNNSALANVEGVGQEPNSAKANIIDTISRPRGGDRSELFDDANVQGLWRLESDGTDESGNDYTLTGTAPDYVAKIHNNSAYFDSTNSEYLRNAAAKCNVRGSQTWAFYINIPTVTASTYIMGFTQSGVGQRGVYVDSSDKLHMAFDGTSPNWHFAHPTVLQDNTTYHVVVVFDADADEMRLYIDGVKETLQNTTGQTVAFTNDFQISGRQGWSDMYITAYIDTVVIWDRALADTEILGLRGSFATKASIVRTETANNSACASIVVTETYDNNPKSNFLATYSKANNAVANIWAEGQTPNYTKANISRANEEYDLNAKASIVVLWEYNNNVKANIIDTYTADNRVKADILVTWELDNSVKANVVEIQSQDSNTKADILVVYEKANSAVASIWVAFNYPQYVKASIVTTGSADLSTKASLGSKIYSRGTSDVVVSGDDNLAEPYTSDEVVDASADDTDFVYNTVGEPVVFHLFKDKNVRDTDPFTITWKGKTDTAPSISAAFLQIMNRTSGLWETLDTNTTANADEEFILSYRMVDRGSLSNYYDSNYWISCRIYQE